MDSEVVLQHGFSDELRSSAAELYDAAFGVKLKIAIPNPRSRIAVLQAGFNQAFSFVAMSKGKVVGIAGFKNIYGSLTGGISFRVLKKEIGLWGAIRAVFVLAFLEREQTSGQLLMDGICVSPNMRGGIGTLLLHSLIDYAKKEGYQQLS